jgi:hypothetical protein
LGLESIQGREMITSDSDCWGVKSKVIIVHWKGGTARSGKFAPSSFHSLFIVALSLHGAPNELSSLLNQCPPGAQAITR